MADAQPDRAELAVPLSVLDRFLKLSQENHEAYSAMVSAVDSMSAKMLELTDRLTEVKDTIDKEKLGTVVNDAVAELRNELKSLQQVRNDINELRNLQDQLNILQEIAACLGESQYSVISATSESLKFEQYEKKDIQELAGAAIGLLSVVAFVQKRKLVMVFLAGIAIVTLLGTASEGAKSVISLILGLL